MGINRSTPWIVAAALGSLVIVAFSWLLGISPTLSAAAASQSEAADQQTRNAALRVQIAKLAEVRLQKIYKQQAPGPVH